MAANNEIGVIQPLAEIRRVAHAHGALLHVDAAQAVGKIPIDVDAMRHRSAVAHRRTRCTARKAAARSTSASRTELCAAHRRRRAGARPALRHAQRAGHRRPRRPPARSAGWRWPRRAPASRALRDRLLAGLAVGPRRRARERLARRTGCRTTCT